MSEPEYYTTEPWINIYGSPFDLVSHAIAVAHARIHSGRNANVDPYGEKIVNLATEVLEDLLKLSPEELVDQERQQQLSSEPMYVETVQEAVEEPVKLRKARRTNTGSSGL